MPSAEDDQAVIDAVNAHSDLSLVWTGRAQAGTTGGAIFVDLPDESAGVVTHFLGPISDALRTATVMDEARRQGLPVPQHHRVVGIDDDVFVVQERLPGDPPTMITAAAMDAVVETNDRFAHVLTDRPDVPVLPLCLTESGDPEPRHEVLAAHSARSRRILALIHEIGRAHPGEMTADDLLHIDLDLSNVLFDQTGAVTGVIDWNLGAYRGDRHLALALAARLSAADLRRYWAQRILYQLHWVLQGAGSEVVDWHLEVAEARLA